MMKEYKIIDRAMTELEINELGEDRWLLVSHSMVLNTVNYFAQYKHQYIFVRDKRWWDNFLVKLKIK